MVYLCDFHREQAWERWVNKKDNGVSQHRDEILSRLRRITHASTENKYNAAVSALKASELWKNNIKLQNWFEKTWLRMSKVSFKHQQNHFFIRTLNISVRNY